ncbi:MAG: alanine--tRNA ligase [Rikenellaceae bacterium]|nr:alanine--tRNA ligase [Rikenellaceae bacterium]
MVSHTTLDSNEIRAAFLDFFRSKGHTIVPSAPMVVKNDPTLMFTNAGMNQFKDIFLGNAPAVSPRVADAQKCLRVSGKHNDLEEVGHDTYHHTMFEMLGNWSFGDYFKKEAVEWAWELLTGVFGLPEEQIFATVFEGSESDGVGRDEEAYELWKRFLPEDRILLGNRKDNFWEMGDTGPCGPCSEVHFDLRSPDERAAVPGRGLVNAGHPHVIEIWNLVFMQYNRRANGSLEPLPARHVDTGMGFERLCMILQGKQSNYDTDLFTPILDKLGAMCGRRYGQDEATDIAMRVVADHLRTISFSIADGQLPSNVKAGYVIRRILRRAVRYGYTYLGFDEPFLCRLVGVLADKMSGQYPELVKQRELIEKVIREEETSFLHTLATGIHLLDQIIARLRSAGGDTVSGVDAFTLYDTYGFPVDLTELIARENGLKVDHEAFAAELGRQKDRSRNAAAVDTGDWVELVPAAESRFSGYDIAEGMAPVTRIARYRKVETQKKSYYQIVLTETPFYGNSGGQVGDSGYLENAETGARTPIRDTIKENNLIILISDRLPEDPAAQLRAVVDMRRRAAIAANHTATHLLHEALREVLGTHVEQKGSLVAEENLRFDFSHFHKVTDAELEQVEKIVNSRIRRNYPLEEDRECEIDRAREMGAMMLFGEKYGDRVRVVRFGGSVELCGGTHAAATGCLGLFKIISESAISAGVRRIEAVTGEQAEKYVAQLQHTLREIQGFVNNPSVLQAVKKVFDENEDMRRRMEEYRREKVEQVTDKIVAEVGGRDGYVVFARRMDIPTEMVKDIAFGLRRRLPNLVMIIGSATDGKATLSIMLGDEVVSQGVNASEIVRAAAREINGGGGGQPFFATAGGKNPDGLDAAIRTAEETVKDKLGIA